MDKNGVVQVTDPAEYGGCLKVYKQVFKSLNSYYAGMQGTRTWEEEAMTQYMRRFLSTIKALELKYLYSPMYMLRPGIDLTDSGFPHYYDLTQMAADLARKESRLSNLLPLRDLQDLLLNELMIALPDRKEKELRERQEEKRRQYLWQISERFYFEMLSPTAQFFLFTPGVLHPLSAEEWTDEQANRRSYGFSWGCYDSDTNRPSVYFMVFTQDVADQPLHDPKNPNYERFVQTIEQVAGRAPEKLKPIADRLDSTLSGIYPKVLKRISLGPLVSPRIYKGSNIAAGSFPERILAICGGAQLEENDFMLLFSTEYMFSGGELAPDDLLSLVIKKKRRQVFFVPKTDQELLRREASAIQRYALMPHQLRQHLPDDLTGIPELQGNVSYLVYDPEQERITNVG